ncbi:acyltransferase family protein [Marisediminicola sp. LYQ85]|uniref:acyltransferase family protein n=1 Tax=Marisediminicola sp. LYQ85 TaxID=3391062 RepID=UPI003983072D
MSTTRAAERKAARIAEPAHFQPHIQGLRAIAVLLVVVYHFWPGRLSGGYIGVDIFFVISGYLITGQLARELHRSGRIALPAFWAKRARRLLPAALVVLIFATVATLVFLPLSGMVASLREILAATFYVENWALAASSVDYLAAGDETMVQHYWSLSLEEQFYIFWPLLLLGAVWLGAKYFAERKWTFLLAVVVGVSILSLVTSVVYTATNPAEAYFVTFTRIWEFGVGAILALLPRLRPRGAVFTNILGFGGVFVILACSYLYDASTPFPGYAALLPVLATAAVLVSDRREGWFDIGTALSGRPQRFVGDISYSLYLWHWPLIVIAPYVPWWGLSTAHRLALFAACFVLAWLTAKLVEDPARTWTYLTTRRPRTTYAWVVGSMALSVVLVAGVFAIQNPRYEAAATELAQITENPPECFGAAVSEGCANPELADVIIPSPGFGNADEPDRDECFVQLNGSEVVACEFGSSDTAAPRVALIGDSHAYQYIEAMIDLADTNGWALTTYLKGACPWTTADVSGPSAVFTDSCAQFRSNLADELDEAEPYDAIFTAGLAATPIVADDPVEAAAAGYAEAWTTQAGGAPVVTIVDNPDLLDDPNKCLRTSDAADCAVDRDDVLAETDPLALAAEQTGATLLDFTDTFCSADECAVVISGANVYRDQDHLTVTFAGTMAPYIGDALEAAISR